ncbi:unnamed protein product [Dracunculus medinensis]|uniref:Neur_chan_memb domain-containing protein n=1 Tax=Dracunculus medinensis TaxID=318479 RepID=A0A0N4UJU0_DRAME|nr:unnamed protein product [Dracunculus medinensis]
MILPFKPVPRTAAIIYMNVRSASVPGVSQIPTNAGKTPPSLEEFDPLNPGEWQLGAGGKILPRLPIGTRCGKLVMGQYGLYDPVLRKKVEAFQRGLDAGLSSENARPFDRRLTLIVKAMSFVCIIISIWNFAVLIVGKPLPPFSNLKPVGSQ